MLFELVLPGVAGAAAFAPVEDEILRLLQRESPRHAVKPLQELQHVLAGREIRRQGLPLAARRALAAARRRRSRCLRPPPRGRVRRGRVAGRSRRRCRQFAAQRAGEGVEEAAGAGALVVDVQQALRFQGLADALKVRVVPEGHELAQVGGTDMQPGQAVGAGGRQVPVESMQLLYQHRLLEPQGLGQFGREHELRIGDGAGLGHGRIGLIGAAAQHTQLRALVVASRVLRAFSAMAKQKTAFVCSECGSDYHKWQGQCSDCGAWNTLSEVRLGTGAGAGRVAARAGLCRCPGPGAAPRGHRYRRGDTHRYGHGRVRSRARRRPGAGLRRSHGRQPRAPARARCCCRPCATSRRVPPPCTSPVRRVRSRWQRVPSASTCPATTCADGGDVPGAHSRGAG
jgi:hypothetical protein